MNMGANLSGPKAAAKLLFQPRHCCSLTPRQSSTAHPPTSLSETGKELEKEVRERVG